MKPIMDQINSFRRAHVLSSLRRLAETGSQIAQISLEPAAFEFSRRELPPAFYFVGPLVCPGVTLRHLSRTNSSTAGRFSTSSWGRCRTG